MSAVSKAAAETTVRTCFGALVFPTLTRDLLYQLVTGHTKQRNQLPIPSGPIVLPLIGKLPDPSAAVKVGGAAPLIPHNVMDSARDAVSCRTASFRCLERTTILIPAFIEMLSGRTFDHKLVVMARPGTDNLLQLFRSHILHQQPAFKSRPKWLR